MESIDPACSAWRRSWTAARDISIAAAALVLLSMAAEPAFAQAKKAAAQRVAAVDKGQCLACHAPIKEFHDAGKHKTVGCESCHGGLDKHLADRQMRPVTLTDPAVCGTCHRNQYESQFTMNMDKLARKEKSNAAGPSPNPSWDKLMAPHGFTREHNEARSHQHMVLDQFVVDRAFGGRFQPKDGWQYLTKTGNYKVWDVIEDKYPDNTDQKLFKPGTAAAANAVCWTCKSADLILDWAYMGDPVPGAKWSRTSKVVELVKDVNHAMNCFFCHDPHGAGPRVVRDAMIEAVTRPSADTLFHKDARAAKVDVKDLGLRGFTRKIGLLSRYDTKLQCGQCHVEYNCNPGTDPTTGQPIGMGDRRTNVFPFTDVNGVGKFYTDLKFRDFRHAITGALLWKAQHPDVENYYGSKHQLAGVECHQCHMPKVKDKKTGQTYTSHWQTSPKHYVKETCLTCHSEWSEKQAKYVMESLATRVQGKTRKAEFWLTRMIDKFEEAKNLGIDDTALNAVRDKHFEAHLHWEWWTASNGHAFHNPDAATTSLSKSVTASQEGIKLLDDAMAAKRKGQTAVSATK